MKAFTFPETLRTLIVGILNKKGSKGHSGVTDGKRLTIEEMTTSAVRPRSYLPQVLIALSEYTYLYIGNMTQEC